MALFDRNDRNFGYRGDAPRGGGFVDRAQNAVRRGWDQVEDRFQGGGRDRGGWTGSGSGMGRPMDRDGGLHQRNSWSDGAWTADAAERTDREWNAQNRYDRDTSPGWRAGGMQGGGMGRGMMDDDRGWNLGTGDRDWGHTGNLSGRGYDAGYRAGGGMARGGGFLDRAQSAVRRGWDRVEERFDRDDEDRMHMGGSSMRGGTSWAGNYDRDWHQPSDVRGYRDDHGHYGVTHTGGMRGGAGMGGGMSRYGSDLERGRMDYNRDRMDLDHNDHVDWDRGYKGRSQTDAGDPFGDRQSRTPIRVTGQGMNRGGSSGFRYDSDLRGNRDWF